MRRGTGVRKGSVETSIWSTYGTGISSHLDRGRSLNGCQDREGGGVFPGSPASFLNDNNIAPYCYSPP